MDYIPGGELFTYLRTEGKLPGEHAKYNLMYKLIDYIQAR
jgi:hypothetical protein